MEEAEELPVLEEFRYFLDLPEEIRREIYRLLVLNPPRKFMYAEPIKGKWWDAGWSHELDSMPDLDGSDSKDETDRMDLKESNPEDNASMSGLIKSDLESLKLMGKSLLDITEFDYRNERHFEIFRVSRQMYSETSTIWYRELEVLIEPEFILSLGKGLSNSELQQRRNLGVIIHSMESVGKRATEAL
ncbi:hypothetical protein B0O99DRAFT_356304 [Bisporella sp. PMI_857]|nr:hypothetical protein B0O99DRAFT_356304 [Bisporella sp. PMI_857]